MSSSSCPASPSAAFDYWESGGDYLQGLSVYDAFVQHQHAMLEEFRAMADRYDFQIVDARRSADAVFEDIRAHVDRVMADIPRSERS